MLCHAVPCYAGVQALPPNNQPLKPANAAKLGAWVHEGPKGMNCLLPGLLRNSHPLVLWGASVCRVCSKNVFIKVMAGMAGALLLL